MNSLNGKVLKSGFIYTVSSFLNSGLAFLTTPIFTRLMSISEYGKYSNFTSWQAIIAIIVSLNLVSTFIRAKFDFEKEFDSYFLSLTVLCFVSVCVFGGLILLLRTYLEKVISLLPLEIFLMLIYIFFQQVISMYLTREQYAYRYIKASIISVSISISTIGLSLLLVYNMEDKYIARILGLVIPTAIMGIILCALIVINGKKIKIKHIIYALPFALPYMPHLLSLNLLNSIDRIMIKNMWGDEQTALYSLAYSCGYIVTILVSAMNSAYVPWFSDNIHNDNTEIIKRFSYIYVGAFAAVVIAIMLVSPEILLIMGGEQYSRAIYVMPPVMAGCAMQLMYTMYVNVEQYYKKTKNMAIASVIAASLNCGLNLLLIPKFGYIAAAYTTFICYVCLLISHKVICCKIKRIFNDKFMMTVALGISCSMLLVNFVYSNITIRYVVLGIYLVVLFILVHINRYKLKFFLKEK